MKLLPRNYILILSLTAVILSAWAACEDSNRCNLSFAQAPSDEKVNLDKEELKLEMRPLLRVEEEKSSGGKQELKLLPKMAMPDRTPPPARPAKEPAEGPAAGLGKKVFATEIGLVEAVSSSQAPRNVLSMDDCIKIATKNHIPLQIAEKSVTLARWRLWENRRNMLPTAAITYQQYVGEIFGRRYVGRKQYIEGEQPVFHGGELYYTMKQAETNLEVVKNDYNRIKNDLVLQVKKAYYSFERAGANLKVQQDLASEVARTSDMIERQFESNVTPKIEYLNVTSQAGQVKYQLASAEGDIAMAELILKQAMNLETNDRIEVEPSPEFKKVDVDFDKLLALARVNRPEMRINALLMEYYDYGRKIAEAKGWMKVDLVGQWGLAKEHFRPQDLNLVQGDYITKLGQQWYAGVKASMPFWGSTTEYQWTKEQWVPVVSAFQGTEATTNSIKFKILDKLGYYSDKEVAGIEFDKQRQELTKIKQDVTVEVKENCFNYAKAVIQLETATNKVKYQEKDLELVKLKRGMDEAQDSNVVESMIKLAQEKFGYLQALADCRIALAGLDKAVGIEGYYDSARKVAVRDTADAKEKKVRWLFGFIPTKR